MVRKFKVSQYEQQKQCTAANDLDKSRNLSIFNFASLIPFFWLLTPEKYFYRWILRHNVVYMKKVPWFFKLKFWAGGQAGLWQETPHHGDSAPSWWPQCTGADSAAPLHTWHPLQTCKKCLIICRHVSNVQVKWLILPQCIVLHRC